MTRDAGALVPATSPFGSSLPAPLACYGVTTFIESSPGLTIPSTLAPLRLGADSYTVASRLSAGAAGAELVLTGAFLGIPTSGAGRTLMCRGGTAQVRASVEVTF